ncbi:single-stranded DNA-binding protein [Dactylosporangium sp. CA-092794]|uniref:single-stranded DNA-binding protein n=1 Tax=Dactylosporangium sp. CA-092794 TaxID=3239929 RepID=UPI003D8C37DE
MASNETPLTVIGNLTDDPELRFTPSGTAVAKFRIASTPSYFDKASNTWKDGEALFLSCTAWRQMAENVAESLSRGARVIVSGRLRSRTFTDRSEQKRTVFELEVDEVGPSLRYATAKVAKLARHHGDDAWASASRSRPADDQGDHRAGFPGDDEPPF